MLTCGELATFLRANALRARVEMVDVTKELLDDSKQVARSLIGQENPEWKPLAERTVEEKRRLGYGGQVSGTDPLLRDGELRESIRSTAEATAEGAEGAIGSDSQVAAWQEIGTSRIPPRPFLSIALQRSEKQAGKDFGELGVALLMPPVR